MEGKTDGGGFEMTELDFEWTELDIHMLAVPESTVTGAINMADIPYEAYFAPDDGFSLEVQGRFIIPGYDFPTRKAHSVPTKLSNLRKGRKGLPLCFSTATGTQEIMTKYDTGTMANHISLDLAKRLNRPIDRGPQSRGQFKMANGKKITAVGRITADVAFSRDNQVDKMTCYFNVFETLAFPALIGMAFLHATETLSKYTSRLVDLSDDCRRSLRLCAVGEATNQVQCLVNGKAITAHADTGAEIALISAEYAARNYLVVEDGREELMLADGSIDYTMGFSDVYFSLISPWLPKPDWKKSTVRFHVLANLQFDVLLDESIVEDFELFKDRAYSLIDGIWEIVPSIATIVHLSKKFEEGIFNARQKAKDWSKSLFASKTQSTPASSGSAQEMSNNAREAQIREDKKREIQQRINDLVQEHNRHRPRESGQSYTEAQARRETEYQTDRASLDRELRALG